MFVVITGVAGSGKTTLGKLLAHDLGWPFHEGDDFHPAANVEKMRRGEALTDTDRQPWLDALRALIQSAVANGERWDSSVFRVEAPLSRTLRRERPGRFRSLERNSGLDSAPPATAQRPFHESISTGKPVRHTRDRAKRAQSGRFTPARGTS